MTPHNSAEKDQIAKKVIMVGDPLRAKFIADNYLENYEIVSKVRGNNIYTGLYKGKKITVMASGMGMSSIGIYAEELYRFYDVDTIVRVGTCGSYKDNLNLFDIIVTDRAYSETSFPLTHSNEKTGIIYPTEYLNKQIIEIANKLNQEIHLGDIISTDSFYMDDLDKYFARLPEGFDPLATEMECYVLFYLANKFSKKAACILTISDIIGKDQKITPEEREKGLRKAIELTLETLISY